MRKVNFRLSEYHRQRSVENNDIKRGDQKVFRDNIRVRILNKKKKE